jgi:hypothetical protein
MSLLPGNTWLFYQFPVGHCSSLKLVLNHVSTGAPGAAQIIIHTSSPWYDCHTIPFTAGFNQLADLEIQFVIPYINLLVVGTIAITNIVRDSGGCVVASTSHHITLVLDWLEHMDQGAETTLQDS